MKLKKFFKALKDSKSYRHKYYYTWKPEFLVDDSYFGMVLIPTVTFIALPWCRDGDYLFTIGWLNMYVMFGKVNLKEKYDNDYSY